MKGILKEINLRSRAIDLSGHLLMMLGFYLLLGLSLLHHLPAHFDPRGEDGTGEVGHIDALQVTHLLCSWG